MRRGSRVMIGENAGEQFEVVHIEFSMAWVRPVRQSSPSQHQLVPLSRLREVGAVLPSFVTQRHGVEL